MKRKLYMWVIRIIVVQFILSTFAFLLCGCGKKANLTLEKIAYNKSDANSIVYLKENNEYIPYLVLTADYNGNALLLRKNLLPDLMPYKEHEWG